MMVIAPASSKALTKLKNDKFISTPEFTYVSGHLPQPSMQYHNQPTSQTKPLIKFNSSQSQQLNNFVNSSVPLMHRQNSVGSALSSSSSIKINKNDMTQSNAAYGQQNSPRMNNMQPINMNMNKPMSALPFMDSLLNSNVSTVVNTNNIGTTQRLNRGLSGSLVSDSTRLRSNSANQFPLQNSLNINKSNNNNSLEL